MPETAKVKNVSGEDLIDGWSGRLVLAGAAIEVPLQDVFAYTQQAQRWEPYDNAAKKAHKPAADADEERHAAELAALEPETAPADAPDSTPADPAGATSSTTTQED